MVGGTMRVMGGRTDGFINRVNAWKKYNSERAAELVTGGNRSKQSIIKHAVQELTSDFVQVLKSLHEAICQMYIRKISKYVLHEGLLRPDIDIKLSDEQNRNLLNWIKKRYNTRAHAMQFWITSCARPGDNYTDASWLLKNIRFLGWDPSQLDGASASCPVNNPGPYNSFAIKGFCRHEPMERFRQLLSFPIEQFGVDLESFKTDWPAPPAPLRGDIEGSPAEALEHHDMKLALAEWEEYYKKVVEKISKLIEHLESEKPLMRDNNVEHDPVRHDGQ